MCSTNSSHTVIHWSVTGHSKSENFSVFFGDRAFQWLGTTVGYEVDHQNEIPESM